MSQPGANKGLYLMYQKKIIYDQIRNTATSDFSILRSSRPGLPRSGENIWKIKFFPGQGKVREFCGWPGKFRKDLKSQGIWK